MGYNTAMGSEKRLPHPTEERQAIPMSIDSILRAGRRALAAGKKRAKKPEAAGEYIPRGHAPQDGAGGFANPLNFLPINERQVF